MELSEASSACCFSIGQTKNLVFVDQVAEAIDLESSALVASMAGSLPIRLTPMTATCRVPPLSRVKLGIGWSRGVARDAEQ